MWAEHQTSQSTDLLARKKERRNVETRSHWRWSVKPNFQTSTCAFQSHITMESQTLWSCIYFHIHIPLKIQFLQDYIELFIEFIMEKSVNLFFEIRFIECEFKEAPLCIAAIEIAWHCHWTGPSSVIHSPLTAWLLACLLNICVYFRF